MSSSQIIGPAHDVLCRNDTEAVLSQVLMPGKGVDRKPLGDQTDKDQPKGIAVTQQEGIRWRVPLAIFESAKEPGMFVVTSDTTGGNLPTCYAPWRNLKPGSSKRFAQGPGISLRAVRGLLKAVQMDGYCLACNRSTFSRTGQDLTPLKNLIEIKD